jgi:hypothetical protein
VEPDPRNVTGDFYVVKDCCLLCGVHWHFAPELFAHDNDGCWVVRQPSTEIGHSKMLRVIQTRELDYIKYRGSNPEIIERIREQR